MTICGSALSEVAAARASNDGSKTIELPRINDKISTFLIFPPLIDVLFGRRICRDPASRSVNPNEILSAG
jgi:hypothetical protein